MFLQRTYIIPRENTRYIFFHIFTSENLENKSVLVYKCGKFENLENKSVLVNKPFSRSGGIVT